jgi:hypothetical protein
VIANVAVVKTANAKNVIAANAVKKRNKNV